MRILLILCSLVAATWAQGRYTDVLAYLHYRHHSTFVNLVQKAGLTDTLKQTGPYTVFAPSNTAFAKIDQTLLNDTTKLQALIKYHVAPGNFTYKDLYNERQIDSMSGQKIRINHYNVVGRYTAQGQRLTSFTKVGNGMVFLINKVMRPSPGSVLSIVKADKNLTTLATAIAPAGLDLFLQDQHPITFFAPTNAAFAALGKGVLQGLIQNTALLKQVLMYHVIPGSVYKQGYHTDHLHTFEEADKIRIHKFLFFGYEIDDAFDVGTERSATNGVVHLIDHVLIPSSIADQVKALGAGASGTSAAP